MSDTSLILGLVLGAALLFAIGWLIGRRSFRHRESAAQKALQASNERLQQLEQQLDNLQQENTEQRTTITQLTHTIDDHLKSVTVTNHRISGMLDTLPSTRTH